jgi:hypothetical protein
VGWGLTLTLSHSHKRNKITYKNELTSELIVMGVKVHVRVRLVSPPWFQTINILSSMVLVSTKIFGLRFQSFPKCRVWFNVTSTTPCCYSLLLTINEWKKWIDFMKNSFAFKMKIRNKYEINWILNSNKFNLNLIWKEK